MALVCNPPSSSGTPMVDKKLKEQTAIHFAITLDAIWNLSTVVGSKNYGTCADLDSFKFDGR